MDFNIVEWRGERWTEAKNEVYRADREQMNKTVVDGRRLKCCATFFLFIISSLFFCVCRTVHE